MISAIGFPRLCRSIYFNYKLELGKHTHESPKKSDDKQLLHVREEAKVFKKQQPACREPYTPVKLDHKILHRRQTRFEASG